MSGVMIRRVFCEAQKVGAPADDQPRRDRLTFKTEALGS